MASAGDMHMTEMFRSFRNADGSLSEKGVKELAAKFNQNFSTAEVKSMILKVDSNRNGFDWLVSNPEDKVLEEAFKLYDKNNDGFISAQELQAVLKNFGHPAGESLVKCQELIDNVDRNRDGLCDMEEFLKMMKRKTSRHSLSPMHDRGKKSQNSVLRGLLLKRDSESSLQTF